MLATLSADLMRYGDVTETPGLREEDCRVSRKDEAMDTKREQTKEASAVWRSTLAILQEQVPEPSFRTWLQNTQLSEMKEEGGGVVTAVVGVPSTFAAEWLRHHYGKPIATALGACLGHSVGVSFAVEASTPHRAIRALDGIPPLSLSQQVEEHQLPVAVGQSVPITVSRKQVQASSANSNGNTHALRVSPSKASTLVETGPEADSAPTQVLNPRYTFGRFVVARSNQLAASVACRVAEDPGAAYNPLFIYGHRGVGKTHLLQAIGNDSYSRAGSRVLCVPATLFDNPDVAKRLASPELLGHLDLLLIDDLQQIAGASGRDAQRWLAILFEGILAAGKGIVVTATQPPDSMFALRDNVRSRLRHGMLVTLELPDAEMKLRVLSNLAERSGKSINRHVLQLLASSRNSLADLVSLWERVIAGCDRAVGWEEAREQPDAVTAQDVQAALAETGPEIDLRAHVGPERIIDQVASYFDLEPNEICSSSREQRVMFPRQIAMYLIREQTDYSYEWIAHRFARQDHTTAMHSCARIEELSSHDQEVRQKVLELRQMIFGEHERAS